VPVAVGPCVLPTGIAVRAGEIRGVASAGMVCVDEELGLDLGGTELADPKHPGEFIHLTLLPKGTPAGTPLAAALDRDDSVLEISSVAITNRPDLWGHYGLAREVAALWGTSLAPLKTGKVAPGKGKALDVDLQTPLACRYLGAQVDGVVVAESPAWLASRLQSIGIRPISKRMRPGRTWKT
jgi:phenylalanyl-tRNA synthetase beta chain